MHNTTVTLDETVLNLPCVTTDESIHCLSDFSGKMLILYFYPRDNTPGCTLEAKDFKARYPDFLSENARILGVSKDTLESHKKFRAQYDLPFHLVSDPEAKLCQHFGVIREKHFFGKRSLGLERSTFFIDAAGKLQRQWRKVSVVGHVQKVLEVLRKYNNDAAQR